MNWSYSKYGAYKKCPAQFKYRYIDQLPEEKNQYAQRGLDKHGVLEAYLRGHIQELPHPLGYYQSFLDELKTHNATPEEMFCFDVDWNRVDPEHPKIWLKAVADAVVLTTPTAFVYDWKTGKIYDDHADQRELYALCVFKSYPFIETVHGIHTYLDLFENRSTTYYRTEMGNIEDKWRERGTAILTAQEYPAVGGYYCRFCSFSRWKGGPCHN